MTALDQAFIKAYMHGGEPTAAHDTAMPVRLDEAHLDGRSQNRPHLTDVDPAETVAAAMEGTPPGSGKSVTEAGRPFRPDLRVDAFAWPAGCSRLARRAGAQLDRLTDHLLAGLARGERVFAMAGCQPGDGCTTMLLAVARRLAARGVAVALADADFDQPDLASALGLAPQTGWEDVFRGDVPLADVVIESDRDRIVLLPLRSGASFAMDPAESCDEPGASLACLRSQYELVAVDLGTFSSSTPLAERFRQAAGRCIDAVVLVQDVRRAAPTDRSSAVDRVQAAGIQVAGVAENFV